jgi:hypothetical protein
MIWYYQCNSILYAFFILYIEHLSRQVLHNSGQVGLHGGTSADSLGVIAFPQMPVDTTNWELKPARELLVLPFPFAFPHFPLGIYIFRYL